MAEERCPLVKRRESREPLRARANKYAAREWVPSEPNRARINSLMYYAYIAGYDSAKREAKKRDV